MKVVYEPNNSYKTSRNQLAETYNKYLTRLKYERVLDYGCGRFVDNIFIFAVEHDIHIDVYDKYNPLYDVLPTSRFEVVVCNNVLNVIESDKEIKDVIKEVLSLGKSAIFKIYSGNKTNEPSISSRGTFQRNCKSVEYTRFFEGYCFKRKGDYFEVTHLF